MLLAHLPAGYLLSSAMARGQDVRGIFWLGLLGSIFPDLDMLYFYLIDERAHSHRTYLTHLPVFWLCVTFAAAALCGVMQRQKLTLGCKVFLANIWLHLLLDTTMAPVYWFAPFSDTGIRFYTLELNRMFDFWAFNYLMHPFFACELIIMLAAVWLWFLRQCGGEKGSHPATGLVA